MNATKSVITSYSIHYTKLYDRDFAYDRHKTCDDKPYGGVLGGKVPGMLMLPEPLSLALESVGVVPKNGNAAADSGETGRDEALTARAEGRARKRVIYVTPSGKPLTQRLAGELARESELVFVCGRYEGIDQRVIDTYVDDEISIGDYVMSSGELAATVIIDTVYRLIDGVRITSYNVCYTKLLRYVIAYRTQPRHGRGGLHGAERARHRALGHPRQGGRLAALSPAGRRIATDPGH